MKQRWQEWETEFAEKMGGKVQPRSGGLWHAKMDVADKKFLWSLKDTEGKSFSVKNTDLEEVSHHASNAGAIPGMAIRVGDTEYALLKMDDLISLIEEDVAIIGKEKTKIKREVVKKPPLLRD